MKRTADLSRLRCLGDMGLAAELFIPAALEEMHRIVASSRNLFDWADAAGQLVRYYFEGPIDYAINERYFAEFHNRRESEVMPPFREVIAGPTLVHGASELDSEAFYRSALYNEIWRPQQLRSRIEAVVRDRRGRALGSLVLYRGPGERRFTRPEEDLFARVVPYIARGLEAGCASDAELVFCNRHARAAALSLGPDGAIEHLSPDALKLLLLAHGDVTPEAASRRPQREDFPTLSALWRQRRRPDIAAEPAFAPLTVHNAWGRFVFDSTPLSPVEPGARPVLHVTITHHEPRSLALRRALRRLDLTPMQERICLHLHEGCSQAEIAGRTGVAPSTVADHVKKIYTRLDLHSVRELDAFVERLLEASEA